MIGYLTFRAFVSIFKIIPFWVLYKLSDALAFLLKNVFKYRVDIVNHNLKNSFPEKKEREIDLIVRQFYQHLADIMLEGIKGLTMSKSSFAERYVFKNPELVNDLYEDHPHIVAFTSHYGNWEWGPPTIGSVHPYQIVGIVKSVKNKQIDNYIKSARSKENVVIVDIANTQKGIQNNLGTKSIFMFISDQGPRNINKAHWVDFLNQNTPCLYGADNLARKLKCPVVNYHIIKKKRGFYEIEIELLFDGTEDKMSGEITSAYMRSLEFDINKEPAYWLWSHRRWKRANLF